jgi:hypothetical protein
MVGASAIRHVFFAGTGSSTRSLVLPCGLLSLWKASLVERLLQEGTGEEASAANQGSQLP